MKTLYSVIVKSETGGDFEMLEITTVKKDAEDTFNSIVDHPGILTNYWQYNFRPLYGMKKDTILEIVKITLPCKNEDLPNYLRTIKNKESQWVGEKFEELGIFVPDYINEVIESFPIGER